MSEKSESHTEGQVKIERYLHPTANVDELASEGNYENKLRPRTFADYPGQDRAKQNLQIYVSAAKNRAKPLDHVLLHGPPGLGKTSLARIIANELGANFSQTTGPAIDKPGDLAGILAGLSANSVLFIDEIHRLPANVEEILYSAMEDFFIDVLIGQGPTARSVKMNVSPFTLIGATTRTALLSSPLLSRFGIQERFEFYDVDALTSIVLRAAKLHAFNIDPAAATELAKRSRGTPRIANRLLARVRDFADFNGESKVGIARVRDALSAMQIDEAGLDPLDINILRTMLERYGGGPVGVETLAYTVGEDRSTIEEVHEPFLVHSGLIMRGPRGRELSQKAIAHLQGL